MSYVAAPWLARNPYLALLRRNPNYRNLWLGQVVSLLGDWFNLIGSAALVADLTRSGFAVGGLFVVRMLAPFLVSPVAGVVADRYDRRRILIATDLTRALVVLGFLAVRRAEHVWLLYALTALQLAVSGFFFPTRNALLGDLVDEADLGAANALSSATWSVMLSVGAAIGGLVAGQWGVYTAFVVDALTFLLSAWFIYRIRYRMPEALRRAERSVAAAIHQYVEGLRYLNRHRDILHVALQKALMSLTSSGPFQVLLVLTARNVFPLGKEGGLSLGLLYMAVGVGTGVGPIWARRFTGDRPASLRRAILASYAITGMGLALYAPLLSLPLVLLATVLRGIGGGINWVFSTQILLQTVPTDMRGRVFASEFMAFTLASAMAAAWGGAALDMGFTIGQTVWLMFALNLIPMALWAWDLRRQEVRAR